MSYRYFAIFGAMRTGSNLLERTLGQYAGLRIEGEVFNQHFIGKPKRDSYLGVTLAERNLDPIGFLNKLIQEDQSTIPGFRIFDGHDARMLDHCARDPSCAKIVLRRSPIDSFISLKIAQETGQWMLQKEENRRLAKIRFDAAEFAPYRDGLSAHYEKLRRKMLAASQPFIEIDYDDLRDLDIINGVAGLVGSPEEKSSLPNKIQRQNPTDWADKVENVQDLYDFVERSGLSERSAAKEDVGRFTPLNELTASRNFETVYAPIAGAGDAAIRQFLLNAAGTGESEPRLTDGLNTKRLDRRRRRGTFIFTFVRHPVNRMCDVFMRLVANTEGPAYRSVQNHLIRNYGAPTPDDMANSKVARQAGFDAFLSFVEDNLAGRTDIAQLADWTPQSSLIAAYAEETPIDFIGRTERLAVDAQYILNRLGLEGGDLINSLAADFDASATDWPHKEWLTPAREDRIAEIYARDYARLGYRRLTLRDPS